MRHVVLAAVKHSPTAAFATRVSLQSSIVERGTNRSFEGDMTQPTNPYKAPDDHRADAIDVNAEPSFPLASEARLLLLQILIVLAVLAVIFAPMIFND